MEAVKVLKVLRAMRALPERKTLIEQVSVKKAAG